MEFSRWLIENWFTLLQTLGIIGGLLFTGLSLRIDSRVRRVDHLIALTEQHRHIWTHLYSHPELARVLATEVDLEKEPITEAERLFVTFLILHLNASWRAMSNGMLPPPVHLDKDIRSFFSKKIPTIIWIQSRALQDEGFLQFVECSTKRNPVGQPKENK